MRSGDGDLSRTREIGDRRQRCRAKSGSIAGGSFVQRGREPGAVVGGTIPGADGGRAGLEGRPRDSGGDSRHGARFGDRGSGAMGIFSGGRIVSGRGAVLARGWNQSRVRAGRGHGPVGNRSVAARESQSRAREGCKDGHGEVHGRGNRESWEYQASDSGLPGGSNDRLVQNDRTGERSNGEELWGLL